MARSTMRSVRAAAVTPVEFFILLALADQDRHGYTIMRQVEEESQGSVRLGPGTLYTAIQRLLEYGFIREVESRVDRDLDDSRRKYYRLTARGRAAAIAEVERLASLVKLARSKRLLAAPATGGR